VVSIADNISKELRYTLMCPIASNHIKHVA
jgi:hypothetical protein